VGVADIDPARAAAVGAELGLPHATDLATLTGLAEADAVILVTPPHGRADQIAAACAARLAILAEKPLADSLTEAEAFVAQAAAAGVPLMVGLNFRYLAVTQALKALFAADRLGPPAFGRFLYERWRDGRQPHINRYPLTMRHPMLWEQSVHHFDLMRFVYGSEPVRISARTWNPPWSMYAHDANVAALIHLRERRRGHLPGHLGREPEFARLQLAHRLHAGHRRAGRHVRRPLLRAPRRPRANARAASPARTLDLRRDGPLRAFLAHTLDGAPLQCSGADHLQTLRMVEAVSGASATSQTITLAIPQAAEPGWQLLPTDTVQTERRNTG
jgi:predicted dehydrogenase